MAAQIERRLAALEARDTAGRDSLRLIIRRIVARGHLDAEPTGIEAEPPHFPEAVDCLPRERWHGFTARLLGMLAHLPATSVVRVIARAKRRLG